MTKFMTLLAATIASLTLVACDSAKENAAEQKDANAGFTAGEDSPAQGPNEKAVENAEMAGAAGAENAADKMENNADAARVAGEAKADKMEDQADAVRANTEKKADAMEDQADAVRK